MEAVQAAEAVAQPEQQLASAAASLESLTQSQPAVKAAASAQAQGVSGGKGLEGCVGICLGLGLGAAGRQVPQHSSSSSCS